MNKNQAKGTIKEATGKLQAQVGQAIGSTSQQLKGATKQVEGRIQKKAGDAQQATKDLADKL